MESKAHTSVQAAEEVLMDVCLTFFLSCYYLKMQGILLGWGQSKG
jgi:hypothetical protein